CLLLFPLTSSDLFHFSFYDTSTLPALHSFPTRRSSDLCTLRTRVHPAPWCLAAMWGARTTSSCARQSPSAMPMCSCANPPTATADRKSTRLNSSHVKISYAVFCLKKKTTPAVYVALLLA